MERINPIVGSNKVGGDWFHRLAVRRCISPPAALVAGMNLEGAGLDALQEISP